MPYYQLNHTLPRKTKFPPLAITSGINETKSTSPIIVCDSVLKSFFRDDNLKPQVRAILRFLDFSRPP